MSHILKKKNHSMTSQEIVELLKKSTIFSHESKVLQNDEDIKNYLCFVAEAIDDKIKLMAGIKSLYPEEKHLLEIIETNVKNSISLRDKRDIELKSKKKFIKILTLAVREMVDNIQNSNEYASYCTANGIENKKPTSQPGV